jgi:hypothetical protein
MQPGTCSRGCTAGQRPDHPSHQVVGPKGPGIYYVATITSPTYEHDVEPSDLRHFRWRTDIRFDYRVQPPLLRSELVADAELGSFRPFRGFEGSNVPVPPDIASALAARAASRLEALGLAPSPRSAARRSPARSRAAGRPRRYWPHVPKQSLITALENQPQPSTSGQHITGRGRSRLTLPPGALAKAWSVGEGGVITLADQIN